MAIQNAKPPLWMGKLLRMAIYETNRRCKIHANRHETIFCIVCMGDPICDHCWNGDSTKTHHQGHIYFQVCAASYRTAIVSEDINKYWDASEIQRYQINRKQVLYLNPNINGGFEHNQKPKCETCKRSLILESTHRFCSIACKLSSIGCLGETSAALKPSKRLKKRKGTPRRSPFI